MKKIFFLFALLYGATLMAQNKAVAVTEVVDKEDKVSYATEIMVRTRLTAAISMKQGYTAYDRVDLQSIMSEQNFQRTGLVDDATIKRLGEMTGASLILIPEVAMSDDGKIYVAVKMLDVTTAQTLMSTGELMGNSSVEVEEGCRALTAKVLGVRSSPSSTTATADEPVTLFGYIHVFPTDIGEFQTLPAQLLSAINKKATYGYDSWRLPTTEELSIMRANSHLIPNFRNADYLCSDSSVKGLARLVTTDMSVSEKKEAKEQDEMIRKKAIFNLLDIYDNFEQYIIAGSYIFHTRMISLDFGLSNPPSPIIPEHPNERFKYILNDISIIKKYANFPSSDYGYLIDYKRDHSGIKEYETYFKSKCDYNFKLYYQDGLMADSLEYREEKFYFDGRVRIIGTTLKCFVLYRADLPSEDAIQQEMIRISSSNQ